MERSWILACLRHRSFFFSLVELNSAIAELLTRLNLRPFKKLPGCRTDAFRSLDYPAMRPLPAQRYAFAEWKKARVNVDYHIEVAGKLYSVPYALIGKQPDVRFTQHTIEILYRGERIASHARLHGGSRIWRLGGVYTRSFQNSWQFRAKVDTQYSRDALIAAEQFGLGGADSIRGFNERYMGTSINYRSP